MTERHDKIQKSYNDIGIDSKLDRGRIRKLMLIGIFAAVAVELLGIPVQELAKLTVATTHGNALAHQILRDGTHAHARNTDKEVRISHC